LTPRPGNRSIAPASRHRAANTATAAVVLAAIFLLLAGRASAADKVQGFGNEAEYSNSSVVVGFDSDTSAVAGKASIASANVGDVEAGGPRSAVVQVAAPGTLKAAASKLAKRPGVEFVKPNYTARVSDAYMPNDPGIGAPGDWSKLQWDFTSTWGVNVLPAWGKLRDLGKEGGAGATIAVIDTGVAYESIGRYRRSPDLSNVIVRDPYDFIDRDSHANDRNGHGTHVASTIFETTNNGRALTGMAYGATLMPIRALNSRGLGDEMTVARAIRYAADHGADVINLSVEFNVSLSGRDLPGIVSAMRYARQQGTLVVAAAGNQAARKVAYPARSPYALSVGATTVDGCLANYSDVGNGLDMVAPGGGEDSRVIDGRRGSTDRSNCHRRSPDLPIFQVTFGRSLKHFGIPADYEGTSMASPHVAATAALIVASGIIGPDPTPAAITDRLEQTARDLGYPGYDTRYGFGLVNAGAAVGAQ
jgi:serine protease